jgi:hypothetical protein
MISEATVNIEPAVIELDLGPASKRPLWVISRNAMSALPPKANIKRQKADIDDTEGMTQAPNVVTRERSSQRSRCCTPADYSCFNDLSASNFTPRAVGPLAGVWNYVSAAMILAKNLQPTIFFRDALIEFT